MKKTIALKLAITVVATWAFIGVANSAPPAAVYFTGGSPTYLWMTLYGYLQIDGADPQAGSEIAVLDPDGVLCGASGVDIANGGAFTIQVYGDDPGTPADEGLLSGDELTIVVYNSALSRESDTATDVVAVIDGVVGTPPPSIPVTFADMSSYNVDVQSAFNIPASDGGSGGGGGGGGGCFLNTMLAEGF